MKLADEAPEVDVEAPTGVAVRDEVRDEVRGSALFSGTSLSIKEAASSRSL